MLSRILAYCDSIKARDPAARSRLEVLIYPGTWALALHRIAHVLYRLRLYFAARFVNHLSRFLTNIDIHPGAVIGRNFFADHGFAVIGETAVIGNDVTIYSGVTLGGSNPTESAAGKRHPTINDWVVIGSAAQIIGPVTVNKGARIGAKAVVTRDVREAAIVAGVPAQEIERHESNRDGADLNREAIESELQRRVALARGELSELLEMVALLESTARERANSRRSAVTERTASSCDQRSGVPHEPLR